MDTTTRGCCGVKSVSSGANGGAKGSGDDTADAAGKTTNSNAQTIGHHDSGSTTIQQRRPGEEAVAATVFLVVVATVNFTLTRGYTSVCHVDISHRKVGERNVR